MILWNRVEIDREGRADVALTGTGGAAGLLKATLGALNDYDPVDGSGNFILARSLTTVGVRNRGKFKPEPSWRSFLCRMSVAWNWKLT